MRKRGLLHSRFALGYLMGLSLLSIWAVAYAATLCDTDSTTTPIVKGIQNQGAGGGGAGSFTITSAANTSNALYASTAGTGYTVHAVNSNNGQAAFFEGTATIGSSVLAAYSNGTGMMSANQNAGDFRVLNTSNGSPAVYATTVGSGNAIYGVAGTGKAAEFDGSVNVAGAFTVNNMPKQYRIDDPSDPSGKYLVHACVEGPEMCNYYRGNTITDATGKATVFLPPYFDSINRDPVYTLTAIGQPSQPYVAQEEANNQFVIKTAAPNARVSWVVVGLRNDVWRRPHPMEAEVPKPASAVGTYLYPQGYGQPDTKGEVFVEQQRTAPAAAPMSPVPQSAIQRGAPQTQAGGGGWSQGRRAPGWQR